MKYVQLTILVPADDDDLRVIGTVHPYKEPVEFWGSISHEQRFDVELDEVYFGNYEIIDYKEDELQQVILDEFLSDD